MLEQAFRLSLDRVFPNSAQKAEADYGGEAGTKWDPIFDQSKDDPETPSLSCSWIEEIPADWSKALLGRQILCSRPGKKTRKSKAAAPAAAPATDTKSQTPEIAEQEDDEDEHPLGEIGSKAL